MRIDACKHQGLAISAALLKPLVGIKYAIVHIISKLFKGPASAFRIVVHDETKGAKGVSEMLVICGVGRMLQYPTISLEE